MAIDRGNLTVQIRHEIKYLAVLAGFGLLIMPLLIYLAGVLTLGPYEGGVLAFLGSLYRAFFTLEASAWLLVLGPYLLFTAMRVVVAPLRRS